MTKQTQFPNFKSSEITPESVYLSRRRFFKTAALGAAGAALLAACRTNEIPQATLPASPATMTPSSYKGSLTDELGRSLTTEKDITSYINYYEFSTDKSGIGELAGNLVTRPWQVAVSYTHLTLPTTPYV